MNIFHVFQRIWVVFVPIFVPLKKWHKKTDKEPCVELAIINQLNTKINEVEKYRQKIKENKMFSALRKQAECGIATAQEIIDRFSQPPKDGWRNQAVIEEILARANDALNILTEMNSGLVLGERKLDSLMNRIKARLVAEKIDIEGQATEIKLINQSLEQLKDLGRGIDNIDLVMQDIDGEVLNLLNNLDCLFDGLQGEDDFLKTVKGFGNRKYLSENFANHAQNIDETASFFTDKYKLLADAVDEKIARVGVIMGEDLSRIEEADFEEIETANESSDSVGQLPADYNDPLIARRDFTIVAHKEGLLKHNPKLKIFFYFSEKQKADFVKGTALREELANKHVLGAEDLDYLLSHQALIPEECKKKCVFFWGTIYRRSGGDLYVRCLRWRGSRWSWHYSSLDYLFAADCPAALAS